MSTETSAHDEPRERRRRRRAFLLGAATMLVLLGGGLLAWGATGGSGAGTDVGGSGTASPVVAHEASGLVISGSLTVPLVPGSSGALDLVIRNETQGRLHVSGLTVTIASVDAPRATATHGCGVDDFAVVQSGFALEVGAAQSSTLTGAGASAGELPSVTMLDTDVDQAGCVGASLALEYAAIGVRA